MYDHDEGRAVSGGFIYHGAIAALRGKFVFGDIQRGRLFASDVAAMKKADDGIPETVAPIEEIQLYERDASGPQVNVTLQELINRTMGSTAAARRSASRPEPRRRTVHHVEAGRDDSHAGSLACAPRPGTASEVKPGGAASLVIPSARIEETSFASTVQGR